MSEEIRAASPPPTTRADPSPGSESRIAAENRRPGTRDWMLQRPRIEPASRYRCPWVEGYCSHVSAEAGEAIELFVSATPASPVRLDLYRMGYYGGDGARHVGTYGPIPVRPQPDPPVGAERLRECRWEPALVIEVEDDWLSGVYLGKLTAEVDGTQSYVVFIVKDRRRAGFLFQCGTNTWQAYNRWPNQYSLYDDGIKEWYWGLGVRISYDRPYGKYCQIVDAPLSTGSGEFLLWEYPLAFWMESHGLDVAYSTNVDTHVDPDGLLRARVFLSVGHDEYWSREMFKNVQRAIDGGVHAAFLSGNSVFGITPFGPGSDGRPCRTLTRTGIFGPIDERSIADFPEMAQFTENGPDESRLMGARSVFPVMGGGDWVCRAEDHWLFEGTGMRNGDGIPGLVGWEFHGAPADLTGLEVVAGGAVSGHGPGEHAGVLFPGPKGNLVFNAGTIWWADGLAEPPGYVRPAAYAEPRGPDARVQRITLNLFRRFLASAPA